MRITTRSLVTSLVLLCFGLLPQAEAVLPPPDGGYPGFTTAEGTKALQNLTTGAGNTGLGWYSLFSDTVGSFNTGVGAGTLVLNTGDENTAIGTAALLLNTASGNTAVGSRTLLNNTTGGTPGNIQGLDYGPNVAVGWQALASNTVASANTAVGYQALESFTTGPVGGGEQLGLCTAVGFQALASATGEANANSGFGYQALMNNTEGPNNTAIGFRALTGNTTGGGNAAIGSYALEDHTDGDFNTSIGFRALGTNMTGNGNTAVGAFAGSAVSTASNVICIGTTGVDVSDSCFVGNIYSNMQPIVGTDPDSVTINSNGRLGRGNVSSRRYKHDIKPMDKASEALYALKPVSFRYNKEYDGTQSLAFGLIAEEVAEVYPDLVGRNPNGEPESVRYDQVNTMLLNEFLKEHKAFIEEQRKVNEQGRKIQKQEATITQLKNQVEVLVAHAKEQDSRIQRVTAKLESVVGGQLAGIP